MSGPFKAELPVQVRFRDTDAMGHVNNAVYLSYLELARMHYWSLITGRRDYRKVDFILARAEIDYRRQATVGDELKVKVRIAELRRSSFIFEYRIEDVSGGLVAEAKTVQACYDYARQKVARLTDDFRAKVQAFEGTAAAV